MRRVIGKLLYWFARFLPASEAACGNVGRFARGVCGHLMLEECGRRVNIDRNAIVGRYVALGDDSGIGRDSYIGDFVRIGRFVMMGPECVIYTRNHRFAETDRPMCVQGFTEYRPVVIGDDVWIGGRVTILPGVRIGSGAVIGAGSVVTKDVESYRIVAGNPAREIGRRK